MTAAIELYRKLGFRDIPPYRKSGSGRALYGAAARMSPACRLTAARVKLRLCCAHIPLPEVRVRSIFVLALGWQPLRLVSCR